jgi:hypothetical protein
MATAPCIDKEIKPSRITKAEENPGNPSKPLKPWATLPTAFCGKAVQGLGILSPVGADDMF